MSKLNEKQLRLYSFKAIGFPYLNDIAVVLGSAASLFGVTLPFLSPKNVKVVGSAIGTILKVVFFQKSAIQRQRYGRFAGTAADLFEAIEAKLI